MGFVERIDLRQHKCVRLHVIQIVHSHSGLSGRNVRYMTVNSMYDSAETTKTQVNNEANNAVLYRVCF